MSNTFTLDAPEDIGTSSDYMKEPGAFHFTVLTANTNFTGAVKLLRSKMKNERRSGVRDEPGVVP